MSVFFFTCEAPFNSSYFVAVQGSDKSKGKRYMCGQNFFRHNLFWSPMAGVTWTMICC